MLFRILWFLLVAWLVASVARLVLAALRGGTRHRPPRESRRRPEAPEKDLPYSRDEIVDASFTEVEDEAPASSERKP